MKKELFLIAAASMVMLLSCEKTYTCECVLKENGVEITRAAAQMKGRKSDVEKRCAPVVEPAPNRETICEVK